MLSIHLSKTSSISPVSGAASQENPKKPLFRHVTRDVLELSFKRSFVLCKARGDRRARAGRLSRAENYNRGLK